MCVLFVVACFVVSFLSYFSCGVFLLIVESKKLGSSSVTEIKVGGVIPRH